MDIRQLLAEVIAIDPETIRTSEGATQTENEIQAKIDGFNAIYHEILNHKNEIRRRRWKLETEESLERARQMQEQLAEKGLKVGDAFYKERNEGIYIVKSIDEYHVRFERFREYRAWCWKKSSISHSDLLSGNSPYKKVKPNGPFNVGDCVMYEDNEYQVLGYMGYRVVLANGYGGNRFYRMVPHKKVSVYRSIII